MKCVNLRTGVEILQMRRVRGTLQVLSQRNLSAQDVRSRAPIHLLTYCMLQWCLSLFFSLSIDLWFPFSFMFFSVFFPWNILSTLHDYQLKIMFTVLSLCLIRITLLSLLFMSSETGSNVYLITSMTWNVNSSEFRRGKTLIYDFVITIDQ